MALIEHDLSPQAAFGSDAEVPATNATLARNPKDDLSAIEDLHKVANGHSGLAAGAYLSGTNHAIKIGSPERSSYQIPMSDDLAFTPRRLRVITVGAGFSGLMMAHKFQHRFPEMEGIVEHTIFEKRADLGGTWLVNTYPGVQCDVPSHIYVSHSDSNGPDGSLSDETLSQAFPFDPNPDWSRFYSSGAEIHEYIVKTAKKWNLDRDVQLNTKVVRAEWVELKGMWKVTVENQGKIRYEWADVLISGQGALESVYIFFLGIFLQEKK